MPEGAVIGVSWILCAFAFLVTVRGLVGGAPGRPSPIHPWVIPSVLRSLAAGLSCAKKRFVAQRLHHRSRIWRAVSFTLLRCRFWNRCGVQ